MGWFVECPTFVTHLEGENTNSKKRPTFQDSVPHFRIVSHISGLSANFLVLTFQVLVGPGRYWLVLIGLGWSQDTWGWSWKALEHLEHLGTP